MEERQPCCWPSLPLRKHLDGAVCQPLDFFCPHMASLHLALRHPLPRMLPPLPLWGRRSSSRREGLLLGPLPFLLGGGWAPLPSSPLSLLPAWLFTVPGSWKLWVTLGIRLSTEESGLAFLNVLACSWLQALLRWCSVGRHFLSSPTPWASCYSFSRAQHRLLLQEVFFDLLRVYSQSLSACAPTYL